MIPSVEKWIVIFNRNSSLWGSYKYNSEEDALRIELVPEQTQHEEWLNYGFKDLKGNSAKAFLHWEKLLIPFEVKVTD